MLLYHPPSDAMNETNKILQISDEVLEIAEVGFLKIRDIILSKGKKKIKYKNLNLTFWDPQPHKNIMGLCSLSFCVYMSYRMKSETCLISMCGAV